MRSDMDETRFSLFAKKGNGGENPLEGFFFPPFASRHEFVVVHGE